MPDKFRLYHCSFPDIAPSLDDVLRFLQAEDAEAEHPVRISAEGTLSRLQNHRHISGGYIIREIEFIDIKKGIIQIENTELTTGTQICSYLKGSSLAALFICTAGDVFTRMTSEYNSKGEYLEAFVVDAIGSLTVENAMDRIQNDLSDKLKEKSLNISNRYSPGYCNWALSGQKKLFQLIGQNEVGITLTDSCLMHPIKSVSGIIGIGSDVKKRAYGCEICRNTDCIYRKILNKK